MLYPIYLVKSLNYCKSLSKPKDMVESHIDHVFLFRKIAIYLSLEKDNNLIFCASIFASLKLHKVENAWPILLREITSYKATDLIPLASKMIYNYGKLIKEAR